MYTMVPPLSPPSLLPPTPPCGVGGGVVYVACSTPPRPPLVWSGLWVSGLVCLILPHYGVVVGGGCWV